MGRVKDGLINITKVKKEIEIKQKIQEFENKKIEMIYQKSSSRN